MKEPKAPCLGCPDHTVGCHGKCEKYIKYKEDHFEWSRTIFEARSNESIMNQVEIKRFKKWNDAKKRGKV